MQNATYSEVVRPWLERFMDSHGDEVWTLVVNQAEDEAVAGRLWLYIFVTALSRMRPERIASYDDSYAMDLVSSTLSEFETHGAAILDNPFRWPDMAEEEELSIKESSCEQGDDEQDIHVPPLLIMRTIQVLHATSAYLDAKRQHKGPSWTFAAALTTAVFACFAIVYGALAHFGYPASRLWNLIFGHSG